MRYRVDGISEAAVDWSLNHGDVVDCFHPAFKRDPEKLRMYLERGFLVPLVNEASPAAPDTAMRQPGETMMRPRGRARRG